MKFIGEETTVRVTVALSREELEWLMRQAEKQPDKEHPDAAKIRKGIFTVSQFIFKELS